MGVIKGSKRACGPWTIVLPMVIFWNNHTKRIHKPSKHHTFMNFRNFSN